MIFKILHSYTDDIMFQRRESIAQIRGLIRKQSQEKLL